MHPRYGFVDGYTKIGQQHITENLNMLNKTVGYTQFPDLDPGERAAQHTSLMPIDSPAQFLAEFTSNERVSWVRVISVLARYRELSCSYAHI